MKELVAAIDLGSNATRLTISKKPGLSGVHHLKDIILKERFPCRLGTDVFKSQTISSDKEELLSTIFKKMKSLLNEHQVTRINAVATSAFRDAENGKEILKNLSKKNKIPCKIISGKQEASFMSNGLLKRKLFKSKSGNLHIDIGGGSLEISLFHNKKFIFQKSLDVGTLRLLVDTRTGQLISNHSRQLNLIDKALNTSNVKKLLQLSSSEKDLSLHGTGGNFRRLGGLRKHTLGKSSSNYLKSQEVPYLLGRYLNYPGYELSRHLPIKEENAALLVPSLLIIQRVLNFWPATSIQIPQLSLSHTLIDQLS